MKNIIIGTAGHIDHGKTTLIKALTGRETDTLDEEKKRGISINLGFTYFDLPNKKRAGIVDVPGHEKFIKNMLAGACGIDMVLLVIAADEGVMPQTIEHLDILKFLNVKNGIIVLTKCDNVDKEFKDLVKEEIIEKIKGTFLEESEIIEVDSISRRGIDKLVNEIDKLSNEIDGRNEDFPARLNIDRVFSVKGFGTVITGTLIEGKIRIDDSLVIYPKQIKTKIRSIQVHGENVKTAYAGQRTAINISNVKVEDIKRGDVLALNSSLEETHMLDVKISMVNHSDKKIKHWDRLRLYHGTREILCRAVPLDKEVINNGEIGYLQLRLEESIVAKKGDEFVVRSYSPMETIGGGIIVDIAKKKHKRFDDKVIETFKMKEKGELKDILEEYLKNNTNENCTIKNMMIYRKENDNIIIDALDKLILDSKVILINNMYIHITQYNKIKEHMIAILNQYHKKYRLRKGMLKEEIRSKLNITLKSREVDILLANLCKEEIIKVIDNYISLYEFKINLNNKQIEIKTQIEKLVKNSGLSKILRIDEVCKDAYYKEVLEYMIYDEIIKLDDEHILHKTMYEKIKKDLIEFLNINKEITLGQYRDLIKSSRKNCMIILENFDRNKITKRIDDKRILFSWN
ncbi:selenocysteine-specific translation elongation factor [Romboutsia maritimum]|uniref:Selenocysteine-specific elongation factor n=1 Tax=Romboutsia maritimum TaxID=2020948 RepID=A0A371IU60_9FIRM|nr:selenocysteine-specific translation elongation factor [Romboutsia maritimum]RDY24001.1 selenocysteine-specific translation elongation factor [Romboutsia maritimum]